MPFTCLAYHRITDAPAARADPFTVTPARLGAQLAWLAGHGRRGVSLSQALAGREGPAALALTFDDGTRDFLTTAWPLLRRYGFGATLFVVTGRMGRTADWPACAGTPLLTWPEVRALTAQGVEIGVHGAEHRPLDSLDPAALPESLRAARQIVFNQTGVWPAGLAFPYGRYSPAVTQAAAAAGFQWAATARGGRNHPATDPMALRRTLMTGGDGRWRFALKVWTGYARLVEWRMDRRGVT